MNETRVIERLNQKHSSGRKRVVLCGQREIEGDRGRERERRDGERVSHYNTDFPHTHIL